jgi:predicted nucleic acid-binding protein
VIFVDTGAWFATFVPNDVHHVAAASWFAQNTEPLITTDYVLDEVLTLLQVRGEFARALSFPDSQPSILRHAGCCQPSQCQPV